MSKCLISIVVDRNVTSPNSSRIWLCHGGDIDVFQVAEVNSDWDTTHHVLGIRFQPSVLIESQSTARVVIGLTDGDFVSVLHRRAGLFDFRPLEECGCRWRRHDGIKFDGRGV